jgi:MIP family channel proteins
VAGGLALAIGVASVGHISGAHLNPAVTLGLAVNRHFPWAYAPGYVTAQFAGATAAAAATWGLYGNQARSIARLGATAPAAGVSAGRVLAAEAVVTFVLVLVVVAVATDTRVPRGIAAIAIGAALAVAIVISGPVSGAGVNPARAIGPMILGGPVLRLVGIPRGAASRRRGSRRPLRLVPARRQHACLAITQMTTSPGPRATRRSLSPAGTGG